MSENSARAEGSPQPGLGSRQDAPMLVRAAMRRIMRALPGIRAFGHGLRERGRRMRGAPHVVDYFHQVDDPYSELALQAIPALCERYEIELNFHLVSQSDRLFAPEPDLLADYARRDCGLVAPHYGLAFPTDVPRPKAEVVTRVEQMLAGLREDPRFVDVALEAGRALWAGDEAALDRLSERFVSVTPEQTRDALDAGGALRAKRRHYSGALFWYAGEWYWGVDRLHHLERRLIGYGAMRADPPATIRFDRPPLDAGDHQNEERLILEVYPSLRSPYSAMIFDRSLELAASVGVPVELLPVLPMVMRGVPAPAAKGIYIFLDAWREARHIGAEYGDMLDPIGRPVERGFSLWPYARDRGRGAEYLSSFLRAAFAEGRPTGTDVGLRRIVEDAGLDWEEARTHLDGDGWREELESNRKTMYEELGVWGVPSYRLRGPDGEPDLCVWGQDRLWLVAAEIRRRLSG